MDILRCFGRQFSLLLFATFAFSAQADPYDPDEGGADTADEPVYLSLFGHVALPAGTYERYELVSDPL